MKKFIASLIALIALIAVPAVAAPEPVQTVIADNSGECGIYRLALHRREDNITTAMREVARLNRSGVKTRMIVIEPG